MRSTREGRTFAEPEKPASPQPVVPTGRAHRATGGLDQPPRNSLHTVQLRPVQSAFDPVHNRNNTYKSNEVSESTVQFLIAEKLASTPVAEDVILAAMESVHPASQPLLFNRTPCPLITALSVEEQKIFQSIDHLNQKLQSVQEAIARNQSASDVLQITTPLSIQQCLSFPLNTAIASQQHPKASASNRLRGHRGY